LADTAGDNQSQIVMAAIVGAAGLPAALAAAQAGKRVLLANKEALVAAGSLFMAAVKTNGAELLPIDSEHNAIFQCLPHHGRASAPSEPAPGVRRLILTASGGPFRARRWEDLHTVTPQEACAHPNWSMGRKISVDSATMLNKGLEVIEAHWLFAMPADRISVVIHPQSVVHSMVEYEDGSVIAQLGQPDMRTPIAYGLGFPERINSGVGMLDLAAAGRLDFAAPDLLQFPCLRLSFDALINFPTLGYHQSSSAFLSRCLRCMTCRFAPLMMFSALTLRRDGTRNSSYPYSRTEDFFWRKLCLLPFWLLSSHSVC
jgi:1-deoxy-D-xylulose-5-phosphate reductoisomerase